MLVKFAPAPHFPHPPPEKHNRMRKKPIIWRVVAFHASFSVGWGLRCLSNHLNIKTLSLSSVTYNWQIETNHASAFWRYVTFIRRGSNTKLQFAPISGFDTPNIIPSPFPVSMVKTITIPLWLFGHCNVEGGKASYASRRRCFSLSCFCGPFCGAWVSATALYLK